MKADFFTTNVWIIAPTTVIRQPMKIQMRRPYPSAIRPQKGNAAIWPRLTIMKMMPVDEPAPSSPKEA